MSHSKKANRIPRSSQYSIRSATSHQMKNPLPQSNSSPMRIVFGCAVILLAVAFSHGPAYYSQALGFDDDAFLVENPLVMDPGWNSTQRFFSEILSPSTVKGYYIPLTMTSLMIDYALGGRPNDLTQFHITSIILHLLVVCLIVASFRILFESPGLALTVGVIAAVHPLTVEPIVWIAERKTMLAGVWVMLAMFAYLKFVRSDSITWLCLSITSYLAAVMSKPTAVPLPLLLLLLDYHPFQRLNRRAWIEKIPYFMIMTASASITLISHARTASIEVSGVESPVRTILLIVYNIAFYVRKFIVPINLSSCYPPPQPFSLAHAAVTGSLLAAILITLIVIRLRVHTPFLLVGWMFYLISLIPTAGLVSYSWVLTSDKYIYPLPLVGILIMIAVLVTRIMTWTSNHLVARRVAVTMFVVLILLCIIQSRNTYANWRETETLYRDMISKSPQVGLLHNNLGLELARQNRHDEAITSYQRAIECAPDSTQFHSNLGLSLMALGRFTEALERFRNSVNDNPEAYIAHNNVAYILSNMGRLEEAHTSALTAVALNPNYPEARVTLGKIHAMLKQTDEAIEQFQRAVELKPTLFTAWSNLGAMHVRRMEFEDAERCYQKALALRPDFVEGLSNYGRLMNQQGRYTDADMLFRKALSRNRSFLPALAGLAQALIGRDRLDEAKLILKEAKALAPDDPDIQRLLSDSSH